MKKLKQDLRSYANKEKANILQKFFKTGRGEYGEGDIFLGVAVPDVRNVIKSAFDRLSLDNVKELLKSKFHEERLAGVLILVKKYNKDKNSIYNFYLKNSFGINNWDLVDLSAPNIVGDYLLNKDRKILYNLARSDNLWERRIAIVSTFTLIRSGQLDDTLKISKILLKDDHDLIHKAVGWMLREVGKKDVEILKEFIRKNYSDTPRTTLRYAIERFPENLRKKFLLGDI
jgi:3-methyladenine DNA glycosylase AlkD